MSNSKREWTMLALLLLGVTSLAQGVIVPDPCDRLSHNSPCGHNTQCQIVGGRPVCSCLPGYSGNPIVSCQKGECQDSSECPDHKTCRNNDCVDSCRPGVCGVGALCDSRNHVPVCSCPPKHTGDPLHYCNKVDPRTFCSPSPCGPNTNCEVVREVATCSCKQNYRGDPLDGCKPECTSDYECPDHQKCDGLKCRNVCGDNTCGTNANCRHRNHSPVCSCPSGYMGNPQISCRLECELNRDCPSDRPVCSYNKCVDPCKGSCGTNANCEVQGDKAICSCPKDRTGNPFQFCRPFDKRDLCDPNPCGQNSQCQAGYDKTGKDRPVCTCQPGYVGNALVACHRGECMDDAECPDHRACVDYACGDVCAGRCGVGADCAVRRHTAVCTCPAGSTGDAFVSCTPMEVKRGRSYYGRSYYDGRGYYDGRSYYNGRSYYSY